MTEAALLKQLKSLEERLAAIRQDAAKRRTELLQQHLAEREPTLQRRYELAAGKASPSPQEMQGYDGPAVSPSAQIHGVPCFWLNALCGEPHVGSHISKADRAALSYLEDVRYTRGPGGMLLEFHFAPNNPFFENQVLRRGIAVGPAAQAQGGVQDSATQIEWRDGHNLLYVTTQLQKQKRGGKGKARQRKKKGGAGRGGADDAAGEGDAPRGGSEAGVVRQVPVVSFFRFFTTLTPPDVAEDPAALVDEVDEDGEGGQGSAAQELTDEVNLLLAAAPPVETDDTDDEGEEATSAFSRGLSLKAAKDRELMESIVRSVIPRAVHLYLSSPAGGGDEGAAGASGEEDDDGGFSVVSPAAAAVHGGGAALTPAAQRALHALRAVQAQLDAQSLEFKRGKWEVSREADAAETELLEARTALLAGNVRPVLGGPPGATTTAVPLFWLRALASDDLASDVVAPRDQLALAALLDVQAHWDWTHMPTPEEPWRKATVTWTFLDNPYFPACTLRKTYTFACAGGQSSRITLDMPGELAQPVPWRSTKPPGAAAATSAPPQQRQAGSETDPEAEEAEEDAVVEEGALPGKCDLTLAGPSSTGGQPPPAVSFFNLFKKGSLRHAFASLEGVSGKGVDAQALTAEAQLVARLLSGALRYVPTLLVDMVHYAEEDLGHELNEHPGEEEEDEEADENDDEEGSEAGDDTDGKGPRMPRARPRRQARAAGSVSGSFFGVSNRTVFLALLAMLGCAQLLAYIDFFFNRS